MKMKKFWKNINKFKNLICLKLKYKQISIILNLLIKSRIINFLKKINNFVQYLRTYLKYKLFL